MEATLSEAERHLCGLDPALARIIEANGPIIRQPRGNYFEALCRSIIGQQVSVAAASTIFRRFETVTGVAPSAVLALTDEQVKEIGLSRQKASYLRDLARHFVEDPAVYDHLEHLPDEEVVRDLTVVKGIGVWTAQMFLMFTLQRPDVFAPDDVGLQKAMMRLYGWEILPPKAELEAVAERWRPWRTVACWHLWESLNAVSGK